MTRPDDLIRLRHLRDAADKAITFAEGRDRTDLDTDEMLRLALTKLVEIVGEAAKQVSRATQHENPEVPWSAAARMRDRLVHHYFDIDLDVLWVTIQDDLPALLALLPDPASDDQKIVDEFDEFVELAGERGDLDELRRLADTGNRDAVDQLVELAGERGDLGELRRLADRGSQDAAEVLAELKEDLDDMG